MVAYLAHIAGFFRTVFFKRSNFKKNNLPQNIEECFYTKDLFLNKPYLIGDYSYGLPKVLHWGEDANLVIGKFCSIADQVSIFLGGNHRTDWVTTYPFNVLNNGFPDASNITGHPATKGDVVINNDVWIGNNATIMSGVKIGDGAVIGAFSVVTKDVKPYEIVAGNPAKVIKKRFDDEIISKLLEIKWWNWPIDKINSEISFLCNDDVKEFIIRNYKSCL